MDNATGPCSYRSLPRKQLLCGAAPPRMVALALVLLVQARSQAVAWQKTPTSPGADADLPSWRIDFKNEGPGPSDTLALPVDVYKGNSPREQATVRVTPQGDVDLLEIPIGQQLHSKLLDQFNLTCKLEPSSGVLTRTPAPRASRVETDSIPFRVRSPGEVDESGWIEVKLPKEPITKVGKLGLSIHGKDALFSRVGAGVFSGRLELRLENEHLNGGGPVLLSQRLILLIAGSRIIAATFEPSSIKESRVGMRPVARVELESVHHLVDPTARDELDPGWWLQCNQLCGDSPEPVVLCRLPLPLLEDKTVGTVVFKMGEQSNNLCWDAIETPEGYYRDENWRNEVILQHHDHGNRERPVAGVNVQCHTIDAYLPDAFRTGVLSGDVYWDPAASGKPVPRRPTQPGGELARSRSLGPVHVRSGLRTSTDMPVIGERIWVWAVVDRLCRTRRSSPRNRSPSCRPTS